MSAQRLIQACIAMPAATAALMLRVEPNCAIEIVIAALAAAGACQPSQNPGTVAGDAFSRFR